MFTFLHSFFKLLVTSFVLLMLACSHYAEPFVAPENRERHANQRPWVQNSFLVLAWHDVEDSDPSQKYLSVSTAHLQQQFSWLKTSGYTPVSVDQILEARAGGPPLPDRAVVLTFDDGYSSFYDRVYPLLMAYQWPAILAPVGTWVDAPDGGTVDFGGEPVARERFLHWDQIEEMAASGLVEIGAHTYNLHYGLPANPQGNVQPAAASRRYDPKTKQYESQESFTARVADDVKKITQKITQVTGKSPRVWVWPYGRANGLTLKEIEKAGYQIAMTLEDGVATTDTLLNTPRLLIDMDPSTDEFASYLISMESTQSRHLVHVDLDYVYDPDPVQTELNLNRLVQRIADMKVNTVALQAFADPAGDGLVKSLYFPNRVLPMRADLFNRAAWQLSSRAGVRVYAWMPVLGFDLDVNIARVKAMDPISGQTALSESQYVRISPFDQQGRERIKEIYADLASYTLFGGLIFHDDALLSDFEDFSPGAIRQYEALGLKTDVQSLHDDKAAQEEWTRYKSKVLNDFTLELADVVKGIAGPQIHTARNMFAPLITNPESEAWFAQNLDDFLAIYDYAVPMVMPRMEGVSARDEDQWIRDIVAEVAKRPDGLKKTLFELQSRDWSLDSPDNHIDAKQIVHWIQVLQRAGARHFGYYPDDFLQDKPNLEQIRPAISNEWFPFKK